MLLIRPVGRAGHSSLPLKRLVIISSHPLGIPYIARVARAMVRNLVAVLKTYNFYACIALLILNYAK